MTNQAHVDYMYLGVHPAISCYIPLSKWVKHKRLYVYLHMYINICIYMYVYICIYIYISLSLSRISTLLHGIQFVGGTIQPWNIWNRRCQEDFAIRIQPSNIWGFPWDFTTENMGFPGV